MIASAASPPPSTESSVAAVAMPDPTASIGSRTPIKPVEQTPTRLARVPIAAAVRLAMARASSRPGAPVQALAPPEFRTTASNSPPDIASIDQTTGAAWKRFEVNTAAAVRRGPLLTTRARSRRPDALMPALMPAAVNPWAAVTLMARLRSC